MKIKIALAGLLFLTAVLISFNFLESSSATGPHGGNVKSAGEYYIEMKHSSFDFYAYLLDKKMKPISNKGISCEAKFVFSDSTLINVPLKPLGEDGFSTKSGAIAFSSCRIFFNVFGVYVSAEFENENPIVQEK